MSNLTFDEALEGLKALGERETRSIEVASALAKVIGSLANLRVKSGLTQRQLAEKSGIKQSAIARMESLQVVPRLDTVIKIAKCLDADISVKTSTSKIVSIGGLDMGAVDNNANRYSCDLSVYQEEDHQSTDLRKEPDYAAIA